MIRVPMTHMKDEIPAVSRELFTVQNHHSWAKCKQWNASLLNNDSQQ